MDYLEGQVDKLEKRIQKIKTNPDPTKPISNLLLYELELEKAKALIAAREDGKKFVLCADQNAPIVKALGLMQFPMTHAADRIRPENLPYYVDQVKELGFPDYYCDRMVLCLPLLLRDGGLPHPDLIFSVNMGCELHGFAYGVIAYLLKIPFYHIYYPFKDDYKSTLGYVAGQVKEFIAFVQEKFPGVKYDEDITRQLVEITIEWDDLNRQIYQLTRRVPCPSHPKEVFREPHHPSCFPNPMKVVEYVKAVRDELQAKVEHGYSPVKEERLRLMWTTTGPFRSKVWDLLVERGVTVPYVHMGPNARLLGLGYPGMGDTTEWGRKLSPIEEVVRDQMANGWGGTPKRWIDQALFACRECKIDAIVNFDQQGCTPTMSLSRFLKDAAEREGIPTLNIVDREQMRTNEDEERLLEQVDTFIKSCLKRKGY